MSNLAFAFDAPTTPTFSLLKGDKWDTWMTGIQNDGNMTYQGKDQPVSLGELITDAVEGFYQAIVDGRTLQINYSGGKDSEGTLALALLALVRAKRQGINQSGHHFVAHSDTGIENPVIRNLVDKKLGKLTAFIEQEGLPLTIVIARPGYASSWAGRVIGGRGLPTTVNSNFRQCTQELKGQPIAKAIRHYLKDAPKSVKENIVMVLGSRDDESHIRSANITKRAGRSAEVVKVNGQYEYYPIRAWSEVNVWELLMAVGSSSSHALPSYASSMKQTAETYKSASGECIWSPSSKKQGSACGSRFGCALCMVSIRDQSMTNLLESDPDKYGHMAGLNRLQRYLIKVQWDWSKRSCVGRTLYTGGFVRIQPDVFSPELTARLLHVCCSLDVAEQQRADETAAAIEQGLLEDNEHNQDMAKPQFRLISIETLMYIEWQWALHHFQDTPFQAMAIYHRAWTDGKLDLLEDEPDMEAVPKTPHPKPYWAKVGAWYDTGTVFGALSDPTADMVAFEPEQSLDFKVINTKVGRRRVVNFSEESEITINSEAAEFALFEDYPRLRDAAENGTYTPSYAAAYLLRLGAVSLAKGMASKSDEMMARGQRYHELKLTGAVTIKDILSRSDLTVLSNDDYLRLASRRMKADIKKVNWWCRLHFILEHSWVMGTQLGQDIDAALAAESFASDMDSYGNYMRQCQDAVSLLLAAIAARRLKLYSSNAALGARRYAMDLLRRRLNDVPPSILSGVLSNLASNCQTLGLAMPDASKWQQTTPEQYHRVCVTLSNLLNPRQHRAVRALKKEEQASLQF